MQMAIIGICGKMGSQIYEFYKDKYDIIGIDIKNHLIAKTYQNLADIEEAIDVIVDFSSCECFEFLVQGIKKKIPILCGTTGYPDDKIEYLKKLALENETVFVWKANYAKGINLFSKIIDICKDEFEILDFVEIHATTKKDAPSGTAKILAKQLDVPYDKIQSLRINMAPAIHEIIFSSADERVILRHEIINKHAFIVGFNEILNEVLGVE